MMGLQWHQLNHMQAICTPLQKVIGLHHQHLISQIVMGRMFFLTPNSIKALKAIVNSKLMKE